MDKGTVIRTVLLFVALVNQVLAIYGKGAIPIDEAGLNNIWDIVYLTGSTIFTFVMSLVTWYKNNYVTKKGKEQAKVLKQHGLK